MTDKEKIQKALAFIEELEFCQGIDDYENDYEFCFKEDIEEIKKILEGKV